MDKFSLYDFMSYFLPGVMAVFLLHQLMVPLPTLFNPLSDTESGLVYFIVATIIGLLIHRITFWLIDLDIKFYKYIIYKPIGEILKSDDELKKVVDKIKAAKYFQEDENPGVLFDKAYIYLEQNDKISSSKSFQSMYFFIRNLMTLGFCLFFIYFIMGFWKQEYWWMEIGVVIFLFAGSWIGSFYRKKMVNRIFNTFDCAMQWLSKEDKK